MHRYKIGMVATVVAALLTAGTALAAKPNASFSLVLLSSGELRAAALSEPTRGDQVTFNVATDQSDRPFVNVPVLPRVCVRLRHVARFLRRVLHLEPLYTLSSTAWASGPADCTARLVDWGRNGRERTLGTLKFHVNG